MVFIYEQLQRLVAHKGVFDKHPISDGLFIGFYLVIPHPLFAIYHARDKSIYTERRKELFW